MKLQKEKIYYLLLPINDRAVIPFFIKECNAKNKEAALLHFKRAMDRASRKDFYLLEELQPYIKEENELSEYERQLIQQIGVIPDLKW